MLNLLLSRGTSLITVRSNSTESRMDCFFHNFYKKLLDDQNLHQISSNSTNVSQYQDAVIKLLNDNKNKNKTEDDLIKLQTEIENLTTNFDDDKNIYHMALSQNVD